MKNKIIALLLLACVSFTACSEKDASSAAETSALESVSSQETAEEAGTEAPQHETSPEQEIGFPGMTPIYPDGIKDGEYDIQVDSSSSMFRITACKLTVSDGEMTALMTMNGKGYQYIFMGTEEDAANSDSSKYINYEEKDGAHTFTVPVEALNMEINCAAFSKKKQEWYGRKLVFRGDGLPSDALTEAKGTDISALALEDGSYTVEVSLEGGSGKAFVNSPCTLTVKDGKAEAELVWSSDKYDYMIVGETKYDAVIKDGASTFVIPVSAFDCDMQVKADTTAMSKPHEIEYALCFDSASIAKQ